MRDQFVDALVGVLAALVRGDPFRIEGSNPLPALGERSPQSCVFLAELVMGCDQRPDRAIESIEVAGFRGCLGNENAPPLAQRSYRGTTEYVKRLSKKEASESGGREDRRAFRSNRVAISQTGAGCRESEASSSARSRSG